MLYKIKAPYKLSSNPSHPLSLLLPASTLHIFRYIYSSLQSHPPGKIDHLDQLSLPHIGSGLTGIFLKSVRISFLSRLLRGSRHQG